jgi:toxin ParE1/3/4
VIPRIAVEPQAVVDAEEIFAYLAKQDVAIAKRFNEAVADTLIALRDNPGLGIAWRARNGRLTNLRWKRVVGFKKYLIFFQTQNDGIVVVRILHGARNIDSIVGG